MTITTTKALLSTSSAYFISGSVNGFSRTNWRITTNFSGWVLFTYSMSHQMGGSGAGSTSIIQHQISQNGSTSILLDAATNSGSFVSNAYNITTAFSVILPVINTYTYEPMLSLDAGSDTLNIWAVAFTALRIA
jgi:hypothetical protein